MKKLSILVVVACSGVFAVGNALGAVHQFSTLMDGLQEVPPNASPGFGALSLTLDDVSGAVTVTSGSYAGLLVGVTASHIHGPAPVGTNAGVMIPLTNTGGTSGSLTGAGVLTAANVTNMMSGLTYVNVHTSSFPGGEIRGQLRLVPEPATAALLALGALGLIRRRRTHA